MADEPRTLRLQPLRAAVLAAGCVGLAWVAAERWRAAPETPAGATVTELPEGPLAPAERPAAAAVDDAGDPSRLESASRAPAPAASAPSPSTETARAVFLAGRVVDGRSLEAIAGAIVEAGRDLAFPSRRIEATTTTAADGAFTLGPFARREAPIDFAARAREGRSTVRRAFARVAGRQEVGALAIVEGTIVCGRVVSADGTPARHALVELVQAGGGEHAYADSGAGEFCFEGIGPGDYTVQAADRATDDAGSAPVRVGADTAPVEVDVRLSLAPAAKTALLRIAVAGAGGEPVAGASVLLCGIGSDGAGGSWAFDTGAPAGLAAIVPREIASLAGAARWLLAGNGAGDDLAESPRALVTGPDGAVEVRLLRTTVSVVALAAPRGGAPFGLGGARRTSLAGGPIEVTIPLRPLGALEGTVEEAQGAGAVPTELALVAPGRAEYLRQDARIQNGRFDFGVVPAGAYVVGMPVRRGAHVEGDPPGISTTRAEVREGVATRLALVSQARAEVRIGLSQSSEPPDRLDRCAVEVRGDAGPAGLPADLGAEGQRRFLLPGTYVVEVRGTTGRGVEVRCAAPIEVPAQREVTLHVPAPGSLRARCAGLAAPRLRTWTVVLRAPERTVQLYVGTGRVEGESLLYEGVPAGRYEASAEGIAFAPSEVTIPEGGVAEVTATLASGGGE